MLKTCLGSCACIFPPQSLPPLVCVMWRDVFDSGEVRGCWRCGKTKGVWNKKSEVEVIESWERNNSDLQGESGRLFVFLSNSLHNLCGCWQLYTAWKGLCLYLSSQWGMFSIGSVVNLCCVNSLTCSSHNHDKALISVPVFNSLGKANFLCQNLLN